MRDPLSSSFYRQTRVLTWLAKFLVVMTTILLPGPALNAAQNDAANACLVPGKWVVPSVTDVRQAAITEVLAQAGDANFVLLGEAHDSADHHLWQVQALAMMLGLRDELVIGMEMFPRRVQPVLDRWVAGELTESALLQQSEWDKVWRFDPDIYMPILQFARLNRIPVVALNIERSLVSEIGASGLEVIPAHRREGVTEPAPASTDYRNILRSSFHQHGESTESDFEYFVQAQIFWDRAFAQALADAAEARPAALVVGIIGSGHLRYGHGVPHQLRSMGELRTTVWLPMDTSAECDQLTGIADSVFAVQDIPPAARPRLGVYLGDEPAGVAIREVVPGSVAERTGIVSGDRVLTAAGINIRTSGELISIVRRQSPGTWLPLNIERDGKRIELVAKFPTEDTAATAIGIKRESNPPAGKDD